MSESIHTKVIPGEFSNVLGLTYRLLFEGKPAGRKAMLFTVARILLSPVDLFYKRAEERIYATAAPPKQPIVFVCGAPRSGTSVVAQTLIKHLPVFYFTNLTSLFPNSPIKAMKSFGKRINESREFVSQQSFYGRTAKVDQPNDALYLWDRWVGYERNKIPNNISDTAAKNMLRFFGAIEQEFGMPTVNKNNSLYTYAHMVADILPNSHFICLDRDPFFLAQSQYFARKFIHGDVRVPYGIREDIPIDPDPIADICQQVLLYKDKIMKQQELIGSDRFQIVAYEDFCARPDYWLDKVGIEMLGFDQKTVSASAQTSALQPSTRIRVDDKVRTKMQRLLS